MTIDSTITVGNLLTIAGFFVTFIMAWARFDKRMALMEAAIEHISKWIDGHETHNEQDKKELEKLKISMAGMKKA